MLSVALTGNAGAGKSALAGVWEDAGVAVIRADELSREASRPGSEALREIEDAFGSGVLAADGGLDRARLAAIVFADAEARARLEAILHPRIAALRDAWMDERRAAGEQMVVSEVPLLFEAGLERAFDVTVLVDAPEDVRLGRLTGTRGLGERDARSLMAAQRPAHEKRPRADVVVDNALTLAELEERGLEVLDALRERAGIGLLRMDLHLHTSASFDCLSDPERVFERLDRLGYGRFAVTDHNRLGAALRLAEAHPGRVIPGEEVKTAEGIDVIGLYLRDEIPRGTPARETIERIRAQGGISYLPHPFARGKGGGGRLAEVLAPLVDVVEVFNARSHPAALNAAAEDLARRHRRRRGAGSDAHTIGELGGASLVVRAHPSRPSALKAALARARVEGRGASRLVHLASTWAKVRKRVGGDR
jgi:dephospho-CoA kinase